MNDTTARQVPRRTKVWTILAWIVLVALASTAHADVSATVNRDRIGAGETLVLTLRTDNPSLFSSRPDLSPLKHDFDVLGSSTSTERRIINGNSSASTTWTIQLAPRDTGKLTIPPIDINGQKTRPVTIEVVPPSQAPATGTAGNGNVFINTEVSSRSVFQSAQLLLTVRAYSNAGFGQGSQLPSPDIDKALVKLVHHSHYRKFVNGTGYSVAERIYAVFPAKTGKLTIPPLTLRVEVPDPASTSLLAPFGATHTVIRRSQPILVQVKSPPASYHGDTWLPARKLTLKQSFSTDPGQVRVGQSLTRHITITGDGLLASQLPPLFIEHSNGLKVYPDQPQVHNDKSQTGVVGSRDEAIAVVPTKPGSYRLPAVNVHWWDLKVGRERVAALPAVTLTVQPAAAPSTGGAAQPTATGPSTATSPAPAPKRPPWPWITAVVLLAAAWLATLAWHWHTRRRRAAPVVSKTRGEDGEPAAWRGLEAACRANDPVRAQPALYRWIRLAHRRPDTFCLDDLRRLGVAPALVDVAVALDSALGGKNDHFDGAALLAAATTERRRNTSPTETAPPLPGLYDY